MHELKRRTLLRAAAAGSVGMLLPWQATGHARAGDRLRAIHAPEVVGVPPVDAFNGLVRMPDGVIRHFGPGMYLWSDDEGLSWHEHTMTGDERDAEQGSALARNPRTGTWLRAVSGQHLSVRRWTRDLESEPERIELAQQRFIMLRPPYFLKSRHRVLVAGHSPARPFHIGVFRSDDDGRTWQSTLLEPGPPFIVRPPHAKPRWENWCCEPTITELDGGRLRMIARTSQDWHYQSFSDDGGAAWTPWQRSPFFGTITMPTLFRMRDGRLLFLWCNTTPLVEADRSDEPVPPSQQDGTWEDVFTNRDALHAAVSHDDGRTWSGFREIRLNPLRNDGELGEKADGDLSVHQPQCLELAQGKVLVACGQDPEVRCMLIFDPDWLERTQRSDDFANGLEHWSTHQYIRGIVGHCAYNRKPGPELIEHPDEPANRVLRLRRVPDESLVHDIQGATWNFPAARAGRLRIRLMIRQGSAGLRLGLIDRWINPADPHMVDYANYLLTLDGQGRLARQPALETGQWHALTLSWSDAGTGVCQVAVDGQEPLVRLPLHQPSEHGLSYVHLQSRAEHEDRAGVLIDWVEARTV